MKLLLAVLTASWLVATSCGTVSHHTLEHGRRSFPHPNPSIVHIAGEWDPNLVGDPLVFNAHKEKGGFAMCLLPLTDSGAGKAWPDPFKRNPPSASNQWQPDLMSEVRKWNWREGTVVQEDLANFSNDNRIKTDNIWRAIAGLGLSPLPRTEGGNNVAYSIEHFDEKILDEDGYPGHFEDQTYEVDGIEYMATGAYYRFTVNQPQGAIIAQNLMNPATAYEQYFLESPEDDELPEFKQWSDMMAVYWLRSNPTPKNLRFYIVTHITNDATVDIMSKVLRDAPEITNKGTVPRWPGLTRDASTPEGQSLIGSPLGMSLLYLLLRYKRELGVKSIESVTIFRDDYDEDKDPEVQLLFRIRNVPSPPDEVVAGRFVERMEETRNFLHEHVIYV